MDWADSFRALPLRSGLESVCDKSLKEPCDPEAEKEFWEPSLPLPPGTAGIANVLCDESPILKITMQTFLHHFYKKKD